MLEGDRLTTGPHTVEFRRKGRGPLYYNAYATNFTLEEFIKAAGLEIKVRRNYYRLKPVEKTIQSRRLPRPGRRPARREVRA